MDVDRIGSNLNATMSSLSSRTTRVVSACQSRTRLGEPHNINDIGVVSSDRAPQGTVCVEYSSPCFLNRDLIDLPAHGVCTAVNVGLRVVSAPDVNRSLQNSFATLRVTDLELIITEEGGGARSEETCRTSGERYPPEGVGTRLDCVRAALLMRVFGVT